MGSPSMWVKYAYDFRLRARADLNHWPQPLASTIGAVQPVMNVTICISHPAAVHSKMVAVSI